MSIHAQERRFEGQGATEVVMPVDMRNSFPLTHEHAVEHMLKAQWTLAEKRWIEERSLATLFHPIGKPMRDYWHLEERSYPLPRHYMRRFALGDGGDMSALIILNWLALMRGEEFNLAGYVHEFRRQWLVKGIDPVTLEKIPRTT